jgi:Zn-dependent peptidase ImmA (M78 family)/DNA-binding XRE family transcriptional regulator
MEAINHVLLKVAREARGWTQAVLAAQTQIGQGSISKYEKGLMTPTTQHVQALADALGCSPDFFLDLDAKPAAVLYRSRSLRSAKLEAHVRARLNLGRLLAQKLLDDVVIDLVAAFPAPDEDLGDPEQAAGALRSAWWIAPGPIESVSQVIEAAGGVVLRMDFGADEVAAAYMHPLGDPIRWFFVNTRVHAGDRVRFSLAHELGHAVLHESAVLPDSRDAETQSHSFAGAFLLPASELRAELPRGRLQLRHLYDLKTRWGVAMQTIAIRAAEIGAISRDELSRLYRELSYRGYRKNEPGPVPPEQPTVFDSALTIHRSDHGLSERDLSSLARVETDILHDLFPESFEAPPRPRLRVLSAHDKPDAMGSQGSAGA